MKVLKKSVYLNYSITDNFILCIYFFIQQYFLWQFPDDLDTVVVKAESEDYKLCAILSIQGTQVIMNYCDQSTTHNL